MTRSNEEARTAAPRGPAIAFVTANTFEFDSRIQRAAGSLAERGWAVMVVAQPAAHLPDDEVLANGVRVRRPSVERRIVEGLRPLPRWARRSIGRALRVDPDALVLPPRASGVGERLRGPTRRALEILAYQRRIRPWANAVLAAAPAARVFAAKALVALPVIADAAARRDGAYVYDVADLHVESGRLAHLPAPLKAYLRRRERHWLTAADGLTAATPALADDIAHRYRTMRPTVVLNVRPRWRADERAPESSRLSEAAGVPSTRAILLYQGAFRVDQGIEELLPALREPTLRERDLAVVFLGFGHLEEALRTAAGHDSRIRVLPAVPPSELLEWSSGATLAFVGAPPKTVNQRLTTPNKLFESLMAGVPVVVAGGTATATLVRDAELGVIVEPWTPPVLAARLAAALDRPDELARLRANARRAALERFNWETEREALIEVYERVAAQVR
jgi:glycosyltransferase involved in cell wall biosynthesis